MPSHRGGVSYSQNELVKQKLWLTSNFNFSLDKFKGDPMLKNTKIEAFTVKQSIMSNPIGRMLETHKYGGSVETLHLPEHVSDVTFGPDGTSMAVAGERGVYLVPAPGKDAVLLGRHDRFVEDVDFSPRGD